ncbi:hypothetical protein [Pedobacter jeongneungensis]|uniref:hypothetical protein n=1 Tax=Pedobacter jeongneungensis TaxID=947309 RepID=UPI0013B38F5C|nr:hypothetical protein [Pedobacter jeongneungensis]
MQEGTLSIEKFLEQHLNENTEKIETALLDSHLGDGGAPSLDNYEIDEAEFDSETLKGSIQFDYVVGYYFGCDDMDNSSEYDVTCDFEIDRAEQKLILTLPDTPEREPDTY